MGISFGDTKADNIVQRVLEALQNGIRARPGSMWPNEDVVSEAGRVLQPRFASGVSLVPQWLVRGTKSSL